MALGRKLMRKYKLRGHRPPTVTITYRHGFSAYKTAPAIAYPVIDRPGHFAAMFDIHGDVQTVEATFEARDFGYRSTRQLRGGSMVAGDSFTVKWTVTLNEPGARP